eukprot:2109974-Ditylum_brightwellii.AAC.1
MEEAIHIVKCTSHPQTDPPTPYPESSPSGSPPHSTPSHALPSYTSDYISITIHSCFDLPMQDEYPLHEYVELLIHHFFQDADDPVNLPAPCPIINPTILQEFCSSVDFVEAHQINQMFDDISPTLQEHIWNS